MASSRLDGFVSLSAELTAFKVVELVGTGQAEEFLATVDRIVGAAAVDALLEAHAGLGNLAGPARDQQLRRTIFGDGYLGPIARNLIKLWYVGIWYQLPRAWREAYGAREGDETFTVSANAYTQGLLWPAVGANPAGARAPGWASWTTAPRLAVR
jgi:hypothetical protein